MAIEAAESLQMELPLESKEERLLRNVNLDIEIARLNSEVDQHKGSIATLKGQIKVKETEKAQLLAKLSPGSETIVIAQEDNSEPEQDEEAPDDDELSLYDDEEGETEGTDDTPPEDLDPVFVEEARQHLETLVSEELEADAEGEDA